MFSFPLVKHCGSILFKVNYVPIPFFPFLLSLLIGIFVICLNIFKSFEIVIWSTVTLHPIGLLSENFNSPLCQIEYGSIKGIIYLMLHIPYASANIKNKLWSLKRYISLLYYFLLPLTENAFHSSTLLPLPNVDFTGGFRFLWSFIFLISILHLF